MADLLLATLVGCLLAVPAALAASVMATLVFMGVMRLVPASGWLPYALFAGGLFAHVISYVVAGLGVPVAVVGAVWPGPSPAIAAGAGAAVALIWRVVQKGGVG